MQPDDAAKKADGLKSEATQQSQPTSAGSHPGDLQESSDNGDSQEDNRTDPPRYDYRNMFKDIKITDIALGIFTLLLVFVGVGQVAYLGQANDVARRAATAAEQSADVATKTLRITQKPIIVVTAPLSIALQQKPFIYNIEFHNVGVTQATQTTVRSNIFKGTDSDPNFDFASSARLAKVQLELGFDIAPHQSYFATQNLDKGIDSNTLDGIRKENGFTILGYINFRDEIGGSYQKRFCERYNTDVNLAIISHNLCRGWNETIDTTENSKLKT